MKKLLLLTILISSITVSSKASHYLGNDLRFEQIGANQFIVILRTATGIVLPSQVNMNIYVENTNTLSTNVSLQLDSSRSDTTVIGPNTFTTSIAYYSDTVTLANNTNGYYAVASHCCRGISNNHASNHMLYTCDIPDPAILGGNSNPRFVNYPDSLFFFIGTNRNLDFSATDLDGDSLVYSIINPYDNTTGGAKPFTLLAFNVPYSLISILGPGATITINPSTGIITAMAQQLGTYVIAVKCEEYRNGVKIGEVVRDILIPATNTYVFTSLDESTKKIEASIYPNPSNGNFTVSMNQTDFVSSSLEIFDITGKQIMNTIITSNQTNISTKNWRKGIYFARITSGDKLITKKVIVQ